MHEVEIQQIKQKVSQYGYEYKEFLGKGSYSSVALCHCQKYDKPFAIKRAIKKIISLHEYSIMVSLIHPNIISLYDCFEDENFTYLIMDYCSNGTFRNKVNLSYDSFVIYAKQMLEALSYCHSNNIAHRDIKPENIFLDQNDHVKLGDFGLSKHFDSNITISHEKCGTLAFLAPEILQDHDICPFKTDVWALGITFFYIVTGKYPFKSASHEEMKKKIIFGDLDYSNIDVDSRIKYLISKMTQKNPLSRPTIDKLLELPMFSSSLIGGKKRRNSLPNKLNSKTNLLGARTATFFNLGDCNATEVDKKRLSLAESHCYKSIIIYPTRKGIINHLPHAKHI